MVYKELKQKFPQIVWQSFDNVKVWVRSVTVVKLLRSLLMLFLVTFPFQVRTLFFQMNVSATGTFNEYTSFFLYLSDLLLVAAFVLFGVAHYRGDLKNLHFGSWPITMTLLLFIGGLLVAVPFSAYPIVGFWKFVRFLELFGLYFLLVNQILKRHEILQFFLYGMGVQAVIGMFQYVFQSSIGLKFLGEPSLAVDQLGVSKIDFNGITFLRAYGTLNHPNILGGLATIALLWTYALYKKKLPLLFGVGALFIGGLLFSFSRSAFLALGGALLIFISLTEKKIRIHHVLLWGSIVLFLVVLFNLQDILFDRLFLGNDPHATTERLDFLSAGKRMLFDYPWGVGLGQFTLFMQDFMIQSADPWILQPVHNVFLLIANEAGIIGGSLFLLLFGLSFFQLLRRLKTKDEDEKLFASILIATFMVLGLIMLFDHYFFTLYAGQVVLFLYFALVSDASNSDLLPRKKS